jgi:hypothetical protein
MGTVRKFAYLGNSPNRGDDARDMSILGQWLRRGRTEAEIADAIEGLRIAVENETVKWENAETGATLRKGQRFTLRALQNTKTGDQWTYDRALVEALRKPKGPMPEALRDAIRKAIE